MSKSGNRRRRRSRRTALRSISGRSRTVAVVEDKERAEVVEPVIRRHDWAQTTHSKVFVVQDYTPSDILEELARFHDFEAGVRLVTPTELNLYRIGRPSLARAILKGISDYEASEGLILAQVANDISKLLFTSDEPVLRGQLDEGTAKSKFRGLLRVFSMMKDDEWMPRLDDIANQAYEGTMGIGHAIVEMKDLALNYLELEYDQNVRTGLEEITHLKEPVLDQAIRNFLGDEYTGKALLFGSYARRLLGMSDKEHNDYDLVVLVKDYKKAMEVLEGQDPRHPDGKKLNMTLIPEHLAKLVFYTKTSTAENYEGVAIGERMYRHRVPNNELGLRETVIAAARHNSAAGLAARGSGWLILQKPEVGTAISKYPPLNIRGRETIRLGRQATPQEWEAAIEEEKKIYGQVMGVGKTPLTTEYQAQQLLANWAWHSRKVGEEIFNLQLEKEGLKLYDLFSESFFRF